MNKDFLEWLVDKANDFSFPVFHNELVYNVGSDYIALDTNFKSIEKTVLFPILLQEAIEGINKMYMSPSSHWNIIQDRESITLRSYGDNIKSEYLGNFPKETKQKILKYLYDLVKEDRIIRNERM